MHSHYARIRHDQWLPRCRSNIGIGNEIVGSFLLVLNSIRLMHESAIGGHDQWLPRCRSNIGIGNEFIFIFY